ncbi:hypothetical protein ACSLVK_01205 [Photorhabdus tasmaniensis]|uniref:hypothetical protein n=1 Tax=Photorhabdus tasmaniensis TaxID=1004159 RepID=UPI0040435175
MEPKVFLATGFGNYMTESGFIPERKQEILAYYNELHENGALVFSSHVNEAWGNNGLPPEECMRDDLRALLASNCLCTLVDNPGSNGVAFELGYATSIRTPIVLVTQVFSDLSSMIRGIREILEFRVVEGALGDPAVIKRACAEVIELATKQANSDRFWDNKDITHIFKST